MAEKALKDNDAQKPRKIQLSNDNIESGAIDSTNIDPFLINDKTKDILNE